jgi:hypothetical protein
MTKRKYEPLPMPTGKFNSRQKAIWKAITSEIPPGMVAKGNLITPEAQLLSHQVLHTEPVAKHRRKSWLKIRFSSRKGSVCHIF